ncbi:MAG TPA: hypothetical protein VL492_04750 [Methylovirgula sp.]|jgi:hypothetical protein|nr:hypothetical protein [Methylovirgula sp.]
MTFGRLTWIGFMVVALGWALLLSGASATEILARYLGHPLIISQNLGAITQATILTGFGLAILGALHTGFGTLKHFFDTVLERTAKGPVKAAAAAAPAPRIEPKSFVDPKSVLERGLFKDRPYTLFGDGSIEIETLLGARRFTSLQDACEFIGF